MSVAPTTTSLQGKKLTSQEIAGEIRALALRVLKRNKIDPKEIDMLLQMKGVDPNIYNVVVKTKLANGFSSSKKIQELIESMLSLEPKNLPNLDDLKIHKIETGSKASINPAAEESKQIKEPGMQVSFQTWFEEVEQGRKKGPKPSYIYEGKKETHSVFSQPSTTNKNVTVESHLNLFKLDKVNDLSNLTETDETITREGGKKYTVDRSFKPQRGPKTETTKKTISYEKCVDEFKEI